MRIFFNFLIGIFRQYILEYSQKNIAWFLYFSTFLSDLQTNLAKSSCGSSPTHPPQKCGEIFIFIFKKNHYSSILEGKGQIFQTSTNCIKSKRDFHFPLCSLSLSLSCYDSSIEISSLGIPPIDNQKHFQICPKFGLILWMGDLAKVPPTIVINFLLL